MKLTGIVLVCGCLSLSGFYVIGLMKKRVDVLEQTVLFLTLAQGMLTHLRLPLGEMMEALSLQSGIGELDFLNECAVLCRNGMDFPVAWEKSVSESRALLGKNEKMRLQEFGTLLCQGELSRQVDICCLYKEIFMKHRQQCRVNFKKYASLTACSGILVGLMAAVLLW